MSFINKMEGGMDKYMLIQSLEKETDDLNRLIQSLRDESKLCLPDCYDCSKCFRAILVHLQKVEKEVRRNPCFRKRQETHY